MERPHRVLEKLSDHELAYTLGHVNEKLITAFMEKRLFECKPLAIAGLAIRREMERRAQIHATQQRELNVPQSLSYL